MVEKDISYWHIVKDAANLQQTREISLKSRKKMKVIVDTLFVYFQICYDIAIAGAFSLLNDFFLNSIKNNANIVTSYL